MVDKYEVVFETQEDPKIAKHCFKVFDDRNRAWEYYCKRDDEGIWYRLKLFKLEEDW
jgi:hypothetical protein